MLKNDMIPFMTADEIKDMVAKLARQIESDYVNQELVLVCPLKGSVLFTADLSRELKIPHQVDFVYLSSISKKGTIKIDKDLSIDITGKHVVICEEIIDAGRKLSFLIDRIVASAPASVKVVCLLDKPARRELPISPEYVGQTIEDRYVIGYGMDSDEHGRNYKEIYLPKN